MVVQAFNFSAEELKQEGTNRIKWYYMRRIGHLACLFSWIVARDLMRRMMRFGL